MGESKKGEKMTKMESFLIGIGLFLACAVDSFLTFVGIEKGVLREINPIAVYLIKAGWRTFFFVKLLLPFVVFWILVFFGEKVRWMRLLILFMLVFYLAVNLWSAFLLGLAFYM